MKKTIFFLVIAFIATILLYAQSPELLNYQGVLKSKDGAVRPNAEAVLRLEFLQDNSVVYAETHRIKTNSNGFFSLHPGAGEPVVGDFASIDWGAAPTTMRSILDGSTIAETQLTSVPYALYAQRVKGQSEMQFSIDSIGDAHFQTSLQVDEQVTTISSMQQTIDSTLQVIAVIQDDAAITQSDVLSLNECIDSVSVELADTKNFLDTAYNYIDVLQHTVDTLSIEIDSIQTGIAVVRHSIDTIRHDIDSIYLDIDTVYHQIDSLCIVTSGLLVNDSIMTLRVDTLATEIKRFSDKTDSLSINMPFFNATAHAPLQSGYHTEFSARQVVPQELRRTGLVVTFRSDTLNWRSIQYLHNDTAHWANPDMWCNYGYYGNITLPYNENDSLTRLQIPLTSRRQGLIISYYNNQDIVNEQFIASKCDDHTWSNDSSWMQLLLTSRDLDKMKAEIARIDTLVNDVKKGMQDMSTFGAWFYITHNELFTQVGALDYDGNEVADFNMVHTHLIPLGETWFVTAYGNSTYPAISFYSSSDPQSRLRFNGDTLSTDTWQKQTFDFSTDEIPPSAQYFSVNMLLDKKDNVSLKERTPITNVIDASIKYNYNSLDNTFSYIGAYVGCNGKRIISPNYRHTRFIAIDDNVYKISSRGCYNEERTVPIIVYYSSATFNDVIGYDIGEVDETRNTCREIVISRQNAPEGANYFIINWDTAQGESYVYQGYSVDEAVAVNSERVELLENNFSCYAGRKLVTLGDSFTTNSGNRGKFWQQWLADWLGFNWSEEETRIGLNGYKPMGVGGAWVLPNDMNSLSIRCQDVRRYSPNVVIVYGGQNDKIAPDSLGSIEDEPFMPSKIIDLTANAGVKSLPEALNYMNTNNMAVSDHTLLYIDTGMGKKLYYLADRAERDSIKSWVVPKDKISFYSAYKGVIEHLCTKNPYATIYCMTLMQCDSSRYDESLGTWEDLNRLRLAKNEAIREIAQYYGVQLIDLWKQSGVTPYNAASLYYDWLHPNQYGYRKLAECVYRSMR